MHRRTCEPPAQVRHTGGLIAARGAFYSPSLRISRREQAPIDSIPGHAITVAVTVTVNRPPVAADPAYTITTVHPDTGIVDGVPHVTDPDGDTLSYSSPITTTGKDGTVVTPDGSFTYTPTATARHTASADTATTQT